MANLGSDAVNSSTPNIFQQGTSWVAGAASEAWSATSRTSVGTFNAGEQLVSGAYQRVVDDPVGTAVDVGEGVVAAAVVTGVAAAAGASVGTVVAASAIVGGAWMAGNAALSAVQIYQTEGIGAIPGHAAAAMGNARDEVFSTAEAVGTVISNNPGDPALPAAREKLQSIGAASVPAIAGFIGAGAGSAVIDTAASAITSNIMDGFTESLSAARALGYSEGALGKVADSPVMKAASPLDAVESIQSSAAPSSLIAPDAFIGRGVSLENSVTVGKGALLGAAINEDNEILLSAGAKVGQRSTLAVGATLGDDSVLGQDSILGSWTQIGDRTKLGEATHTTGLAIIGNDVNLGVKALIKQGAKIDDGVTVGDNFELGANSSIGVNSTVGNNVRIDHDSFIGNSVQVGNGAFLGLDVVVGDSVTVGEETQISDRATIGDGAQIGAQSIVEFNTLVPQGAVIPPRSIVSPHGIVRPRPADLPGS